MPPSWAAVSLVILSGSGLSEPDHGPPFLRTQKRFGHRGQQCPVPWDMSDADHGARAGCDRLPQGHAPCYRGACAWVDAPVYFNHQDGVAAHKALAKALKCTPTATSYRFGRVIGRGCSGTRKGPSREQPGCACSWPKKYVHRFFYYKMFTLLLLRRCPRWCLGQSRPWSIGERKFRRGRTSGFHQRPLSRPRL